MPAAAKLAALLAVAAVLAACGTREAPVCSAAMPSPAALRADPAFASLTFHKHSDYDVRRGVGYDLWGDSRFEYRSALEFQLVPAAGARSDDDLCVDAISLRFVAPVDAEKARSMIAALVGAVAPRSRADPAVLRRDLEHALEEGSKYALVTSGDGMAVHAGRVAHPVRGEVFVVSFSWAR